MIFLLGVIIGVLLHWAWDVGAHVYAQRRYDNEISETEFHPDRTAYDVPTMEEDR